MWTLDTRAETNPNTSRFAAGPFPRGSDWGDSSGTWPLGLRGTLIPTPCPGRSTSRVGPLRPDRTTTAQCTPAEVPWARVFPGGGCTENGVGVVGPPGAGAKAI